ncbi:MAG: ABC transporter ATP-binding protein [Chloroflexi bacterium]|nr:ABC transporter ATP-binding protein [Chloroflexota bacterium]
MAPALETRGLRKDYVGRTAVADLSLTVQPGEVFGFLGPNGAGKTTAVKMLLGLVRPTAGWGRVLGAPLSDPQARRRIGFLPEHFRFHEWLTATEFLDFHGHLYGMPAAQRRERIPQVLEAVGLVGRASDRLRTFSRGMLQRIGLGQAILHRPTVVFLDEPTSALDPLGRRDVRELIRRLKADGVTVFLNSHLLSEVELVCDRVAIIDRGRVVREGSLHDLLRTEWELEVRAEPLTPALLARLRDVGATVVQNGAALTLTLPERALIPRVAEAVVQSGSALYGLTVHERTLEDLFVASVAGGGER